MLAAYSNMRLWKCVCLRCVYLSPSDILHSDVCAVQSYFAHLALKSTTRAFCNSNGSLGGLSHVLGVRPRTDLCGSMATHHACEFNQYDKASTESACTKKANDKHYNYTHLHTNIHTHIHVHTCIQYNIKGSVWMSEQRCVSRSRMQHNWAAQTQ